MARATTNAVTEISFDVSQRADRLIGRIIRRAKEAFGAHPGFDAMSLRMDITATHANGTPLRLADLLAADDFNFTHDVLGIIRHLDRRTGQLGGMFLPRFAKKPAKRRAALSKAGAAQ